MWQRMYVVGPVHDGTVHARAAYVVGEDQMLRFDQHPGLANRLYESLEQILTNELAPDDAKTRMSFKVAGL